MENTSDLPNEDKPVRVKRFLTPEIITPEEELNKQKFNSMDAKSTIFSNPQELRCHKINRAIFLFVLVVIGFHILCALNVTYDGYPLAKFNKWRIGKHTEICYFGVIPVWVSNIFYGLYIVYGIAVVYGVTGVIAKTNKIK